MSQDVNFEIWNKLNLYLNMLKYTVKKLLFLWL